MTEVQPRKLVSTEIQERQTLLAARVQYYRDLGIYDFYRRGEPLENAALLEISELSAISDETQSHNSIDVEEQEISARKPFPPAPAIAGIIEPAKRADALNVIRQDIGECTRCALSAGRNKIVFGDGDPSARLLFVGEGPGADEDAQGLPFVGRAGQLLNNMINAMGLSRDQVYIANIVKCRPPGNRVPEPEEAHTCTQFLFRQIDVIRPEVIVALGSTAATYLLGGKSPLNALRGRVHSVRGARLIVTYHPAFLLRDPRQKKEAWRDLQIAMAELDLTPPTREQSTQTP
jgi:uracil-DNA glycosylase family 4